MLSKLLVIAFFIVANGVQEEFTCVKNDNEETTVVTPVQRGFPGKRGPEGSKGIRGLKGSKGDPGVSDTSLTNTLQAELNSLRQQVENLNAEMASKEALLRGYVELEDGWIAPFNGFQYKLTPTRQSWDQSRSICQRWESDLVVHGVQDSGTKIKIRQALSITGNYWIGLNDKIIESAWNWVNGDVALTNDHTVWRPDQPDGGTVQDCAFVTALQAGLQAIDTTCTDRRFALCEKTV